jgi:hypothetical protein
LPPAIVERPDKKGLVVPIGRWFAGPLNDWVTELERSLAARGLTVPQVNGRGEFDRSRYTRVCLELWLRRFFPSWHA